MKSSSTRNLEGRVPRPFLEYLANGGTRRPRKNKNPAKSSSASSNLKGRVPRSYLVYLADGGTKRPKKGKSAVKHSSSSSKSQQENSGFSFFSKYLPRGSQPEQNRGKGEKDGKSRPWKSTYADMTVPGGQIVKSSSKLQLKKGQIELNYRGGVLGW